MKKFLKFLFIAAQMMGASYATVKAVRQRSSNFVKKMTPPRGGALLKVKTSSYDPLDVEAAYELTEG